MVARTRDRRARHGNAELPGELRDAGDLRQGERLAKPRPGLFLQLLELAVGGYQAPRPVDASLDRARVRWSACHGGIQGR